MVAAHQREAAAPAAVLTRAGSRAHPRMLAQASVATSAPSVADRTRTRGHSLQPRRRVRRGAKHLRQPQRLLRRARTGQRCQRSFRASATFSARSHRVVLPPSGRRRASTTPTSAALIVIWPIREYVPRLPLRSHTRTLAIRFGTVSQSSASASRRRVARRSSRGRRRSAGAPARASPGRAQ